jgi:hypothetical protein
MIVCKIFYGFYFLKMEELGYLIFYTLTLQMQIHFYELIRSFV